MHRFFALLRCPGTVIYILLFHYVRCTAVSLLHAIFYRTVSAQKKIRKEVHANTHPGGVPEKLELI
jgi:hypothetical protein